MSKKIITFSLLLTFVVLLNLQTIYGRPHTSEESSNISFVSKKNIQENLLTVTGISDNQEVTFDSSRTISGRAPSDSKILITLYSKKDGKFVESTSYLLDIGQSGFFSQEVKISLGENLIEVNLLLNEQEVKKEFFITRMNSEIKNKLENSIVLPGQTPQF